MATTQCKVCQHPQHNDIDGEIQAGHTIRDIAGQYGFSKSAVDRHKSSHVQVVASVKKRDKAGHAPPDRARVTTPPRKQGQNIQQDVLPATQTAFLAAFVELANESGACRAVSIDRDTLDWWENHDTAFKDKYAFAQKQVNDAIRGEIYRRGVAGYEETLMAANGDTVNVKRYSDRLIEFIAKSRMRSEFGDKSQVELSGPNGGPIQIDQWITLRTVIFQALAPFPDARQAVVQAIAQADMNNEPST